MIGPGLKITTLADHFVHSDPINPTLVCAPDEGGSLPHMSFIENATIQSKANMNIQAAEDAETSINTKSD